MYCTRCGTPARILRFCTKCGRDLRMYQRQFDACRSAAAQGTRISSVDPAATTDRELAPGGLSAIATDRTKPLLGVATQSNLRKRNTLPIQPVVTRQERQRMLFRGPLMVGLSLLALFALSFGFMRWQQKQGQGLPVVRASEVPTASPIPLENAKPGAASAVSVESLPLAKALSSMADAVEPAPSAPVEAPAPQGATTRPTVKKAIARPAVRKTVAARPILKPAEKKAEAKNADRDEDSKKQKAAKEKDRDKDSSERVERYAIRNAYRYGSALDAPVRFGPVMRSECRQRRR